MSTPMLATVLANLLSPPATRRFPTTRRDPFDGARGTVTFDVGGCNFCGLCSLRCPANAIEVAKAERRILFEPFRCILCGLCVEMCRRDCVRMSGACRAPSGEKPVERYVAE